MAFLVQRALSALLPRAEPRGTFDMRTRPERVVLGVRDGVQASGKPPVRIFLGTELAQHRAERNFIWSIEQVRDPSRVYEIHLMKEIRGFDRRRWLTGFTNYRFAIPEFAGGAGRAIYNDEDQIYLTDPGILFDTEMNGHGYLSVSDNDTSVMLLDCARMSTVWDLSSARHLHKNRLLAKARDIAGLWGRLDPGWNARDEEYTPGRSHLIHYTALHTQPWRPFPGSFVYQDSREAGIWRELERSADAAGFTVFDWLHPSVHFQALSTWLAEAAPGSDAARVDSRLLEEVEAPLRSRVPAGTFRAGLVSVAGESGHGLVEWTRDGAVEPRAGRVECLDTLDYLPDEDIPWILQRLLQLSGGELCIAVQEKPRDLKVGSRTLSARARDVSWWTEALARAAVLHPHIAWKLVVHDAQRSRMRHVRLGGDLGRAPRVWVLSYRKPGHSIQAIGLARALGWPFEEKTLRFNALAYLHRGISRLFGLTEASAAGLARESREALSGPWPEVVIATGWRPAGIARWIVRQSLGRTRAVLMGRMGVSLVSGEDVLVTCRHFQLPWHPQRLVAGLPPNPVTPSYLAAAADRWTPLFAEQAQPRIGVLVGGPTEQHRFSENEARLLGAQVRALAQRLGGSIAVITSRRTGTAATRALRASLGNDVLVHPWQADDPENPYAGFLALSDVLVVTGDSESMIAEAVAAAKPVYLFRLPERPPGLRARVARWVVQRAHARPRNRRGTVRPQQGLEYLCARLLERNIVQPPRDLNALYRVLVERGQAAFLDDSASQPPGNAPYNETEAVALDVKERLRYAML